MQQFSHVRPVRQPRPVSVDRLLTESLALAHGRWPRTPLTKVDVDSRLGGVPPIAGDATALREALGHIIDNAMDAMPRGGRLLVETRASGTTVTLAITDTGIGMSEAVRLHALEPFFTTKGLKATGLGLSVAYGVVRSHGGELTISSAEGAGTTVTITLPRTSRTE
jgi:signal transduction histidine kinase